jgi:hypothetical protein
MSNIAKERADLIAKHQKELAKLDKASDLFDALEAAGLPAPDFYCVHDDHFSVSWNPANDSIRGKWSLAEGVEMIGKLKPFVVPMNPAMNAPFRSISPASVGRGDGNWVSDGIDFDVEIRQNLFGESADYPGPVYHESSLGCWAKVGGVVIRANIKLGMLPMGMSVHYERMGRRFVKPNIPGSRQYSFGGGGKYSADVHYLFQSFECLESALLKKEAA